MLNYFTKFAKKTFFAIAKLINNFFNANKKNVELEKTVDCITIRINEITEELIRNLDMHKQASDSIITLHQSLINCSKVINEHNELIYELKNNKNNYIHFFDNDEKYGKHN